MKKLMVCLAAAVWWVLPTDLPSCPVMFPSAHFVLSGNPVRNAKEIAEGRLGIVLPSWWRRYLVVSYRYLSGKPLTELERAAFLGGPFSGVTDPDIAPWLEARIAAVPAAAEQKIEAMRGTPGNFGSYLNCSPDAFGAATRRLNELAGKYGKSSEPVKDWLAAQDTVFSNCKEGKNIPGPAAGEFAFDREYQIASANFYSEQFDEARRRFQAIARDARSPYRVIAPYLAARALIRQATLPEKTDPGLLRQADRELLDLANDPSRPALHDAALALSHFTGARVRQAGLLRELSASLSNPGREKTFEADLADFLFVMDRLETKDDDLGDLALWVRVYQGDPKDMAGAALRAWRQKRSLPWLVAALRHFERNSPQAAELIEEARKIRPDSPAYPTVLSRRFQAEIALGRGAAVRDEIDRLLPALRKSWPAGSLNEVLAIRLSLARSLDDMLAFAPRIPAGVFTWSEGDEEKADDRPAFDEDARAILDNGLPLRSLWTAARSPRLPGRLRRSLAVAAFARAISADDQPLALEIMPEMRRHFPAQAAQFDAYSITAPGAERRFAGVFLVLHNPGIQLAVRGGVDRRIDMNLDEVDQFRDNWFCGWAAAPKAGAPFLSAAEKQQLDRELAQRDRLPSSPTGLGRIAIDWASKHPEDPRSPEALYQVVHATRYGCGDKQNGEISKSAFTLLHQRWPSSPWTRQTPYWYQ